MRRIKLVLAVASMAMLLMAFASPAMANDNHNDWSWNNGFNHNGFFDNNDRFFVNDFVNPFFNDSFFNDNGIFQASEQDVESGDSSQTFNVTGGGDNSNSCQGIQGISNTGNAMNSTNVLQANPFDNGVDNGFFNQGEVGVFDTGNFEISPSSTTTCDQQVNQAASATG